MNCGDVRGRECSCWLGRFMPYSYHGVVKGQTVLWGVADMITGQKEQCELRAGGVPRSVETGGVKSDSERPVLTQPWFGCPVL